MCKMNKVLKSYSICLIAFSMQLLQLPAILAVSIGGKNSIDYNMINENQFQNENSLEMQLNADDQYINYLESPKGRQKRMTANACGKLTGPVQKLTIAKFRRSAMDFLKVVILQTEIELSINTINIGDFQDFRLHSYLYEFLNPVKPNDEPNLSQWHHIMEIYEHTFNYLLLHQQNRGRNRDLIKELQELRITSEKVLCEIQSIALHLEETPTLELLTANEKTIIETNLRTSKKPFQNADEIDLKFAKVLYKENIHNMAKSLTKCIQDCECVKGVGECKSLVEI